MRIKLIQYDQADLCQHGTAITVQSQVVIKMSISADFCHAGRRFPICLSDLSKLRWSLEERKVRTVKILCLVAGIC